MVVTIVALFFFSFSSVLFPAGADAGAGGAVESCNDIDDGVTVVTGDGGGNEGGNDCNAVAITP